MRDTQYYHYCNNNVVAGLDDLSWYVVVCLECESREATRTICFGLAVLKSKQGIYSLNLEPYANAYEN